MTFALDPALFGSFTTPIASMLIQTNYECRRICLQGHAYCIQWNNIVLWTDNVIFVHPHGACKTIFMAAFRVERDRRLVKLLKHICLFYEETPSHSLIPRIVRMARWPKTAGELEGYISAESVRTIRKARELCL